MLSPTQIRLRAGKLTASRVACLMRGDEMEILNLWRDLTGDPTYQEPDLSGIWAVALGSHTESLSLDWYERRTGKPLSRRGDVVVHPFTEWAAATLDAWDDDMRCPVEAKHVGGFEKTAAILERYAAQAHWQMIVTGADKCVFSIIEGAREPIIEIVEKDKSYSVELWERAEHFMECVSNLTPPVVLPPVESPKKAEKVYDFGTNNSWVANAATWLSTRQSAKDFAACEKELKTLIPSDAMRVTGGGLEAKRDRANRISIRELA